MEVYCIECTRIGGIRQRKNKMRKIKNEIEGYEVTILTETHLDKDEYEIIKIEKNLNEYHIFHVHNIEREQALEVE